MRKNLRMMICRAIVFALAAALLWLAVSSCKSGSQPAYTAQAGKNGLPSAPAQGGGESSPERNLLALAVQSPAGMQPGMLFDAALSYEFSQQVYQGAARISFDPEIFEPVAVKKSDALVGAVFMCKLDAPGIVPLAFTWTEGGGGIGAGKGKLVTLTFRLKKTPGAGARIVFINDPAYLQIRDAAGKRLSFDIRTEVAGK